MSIFKKAIQKKLLKRVVMFSKEYSTYRSQLYTGTIDDTNEEQFISTANLLISDITWICDSNDIDIGEMTQSILNHPEIVDDVKLYIVDNINNNKNNKGRK